MPPVTFTATPGRQQQSPDAGRETLLPLASVGVDPARFQPRDVPKGQEVDPAKVAEITGNYRPQEFDAILVVRDPANPGQYITVAGHHRRAAAIELDRARLFDTPGQIPARILDVDVSTPAGLAQAQDIASRTNTTVAGLTQREYIQRIRALRARGAGPTAIGNELRTLRGPNLPNHIWASNLSDATLDKALLFPDMWPVGVEAGRAMEKYGISQAQADQMVQKYLTMLTEDGFKPPPYLIMRRAIDKAFTKRERATQNAFAFHDDPEIFNTALNAIVEAGKEAELAQKEERRIKTRMSACEKVATEMGIDVSDLRQKVDAKVQEKKDERSAAALRSLDLLAEQAGYESHEASVTARKAELAAEAEARQEARDAARRQLEIDDPEEAARLNAAEEAQRQRDIEFGARFKGMTTRGKAVAMEMPAPEPEPEPAVASPPPVMSMDMFSGEMAAPTAKVEIVREDEPELSPTNPLYVPPEPTGDESDSAMAGGALMPAPEPATPAVAAKEDAIEDASYDGAVSQAELAAIVPDVPPNASPEECSLAARQAVQAGIAAERVAESAESDKATAQAELNALVAQTGLPAPEALPGRVNTLRLMPDGDAIRAYGRQTPTPTDFAGKFERADERLPSAPPFRAEMEMVAERQSTPSKPSIVVKPPSAVWQNLSEPERLAAIDRYNALAARIAAADRAIAGAEIVIARAEAVTREARDCRFGSAPATTFTPAPITIRARQDVIREYRATPRDDRQRTAQIARDIETATKARKGRRHMDPFARKGDIPGWARNGRRRR